jgi:hypothetical protein
MLFESFSKTFFASSGPPPSNSERVFYKNCIKLLIFEFLLSLSDVNF